MTTERTRPYLRKAVILGGGNQKRTKSASRLMRAQEDTFNYKRTDAVEPIISLERLSNYMYTCIEHARAVRLKAGTVVSKIQINAIEGQETEKKRQGNESLDAEEKRVWEVIDNLHPRLSAHEIFLRVVTDYYAMGCGYMEVLRYGDGTTQQTNHAPGQSMRIRQDYIGFVQQFGDTYRYFKFMGDTDLPMSCVTGKIPWDTQKIRDYFFDKHNIMLDENRIKKWLVARKGDYDEHDEATEILDFQKYYPGSDYYGIPDCISCMTDMEILESAKDYNYYFFKNRAMARWALVTKGPDGWCSPEQERVIVDYFGAGTKGNENVGKTIWLDMPPDVVTEWQRLDFDPQEGSWLKLMTEIVQNIARTEGVPLNLLGIVTPQGIGGTKTEQENEQFKEQVVDPDQEFFSGRLNKMLIWPEWGLHINNWELGFTPFDIDKTSVDVENYSKIDSSGHIGHREKRIFAQRLGLISDPEEKDLCLVDSRKIPITQWTDPEGETPGKSPEETLTKSLRDMKGAVLEMNARQQKEQL